MICPKCKHDVMNVNGRYVCVECGSELTEDQLEYGSDAALAAPQTATTDSPAAVAVPGEAPESLIQTVEGIPEVTPEIPEIAPEEIVPSTAPSIEPEQDMPPVQDPVDETPISEILDTQAEEAISVKPELPISDLTSVPVDEPQTPENSENLEVVKSEPTLDTFEGVNPIDEAASAVPEASAVSAVETQTVSEPVETSVATEEPEAVVAETQTTPEPVDFPPPAISSEVNEIPVVSDVQMRSEPVQPAVPVDTPSPVSAPVDMFAQTTPANADPNIYQNPIFDQSAMAPGSEANGKSDEELVSDKIASDNKKMYAILIVGAIVFIIFIIGGIIAYINLTK